MWLPSGGSLVIDRTEAMTVVDVNTGKFVGSGGNLEETVTKNNLEAAEEIVRQLRLRDIGGIIVVDFIDMVLESNRDLVLRRLVECLSRDRTKHQVAEVTSLGLVQMTRKKLGLGLLESFSEPCEVCAGRGIIVHHEPIVKHRPPAAGRARPQRGRGRGGSGGSQQARQPAAEPKAHTGTHAITEDVKHALAQIAASTIPHTEHRAGRGGCRRGGRRDRAADAGAAPARGAAAPPTQDAGAEAPAPSGGRRRGRHRRVTQEQGPAETAAAAAAPAERPEREPRHARARRRGIRGTGRVPLLDLPPVAPVERKRAVRPAEAEVLLDSVLDALPAPKKAGRGPRAQPSGDHRRAESRWGSAGDHARRRHHRGRGRSQASSADRARRSRGVTRRPLAASRRTSSRGDDRLGAGRDELVVALDRDVVVVEVERRWPARRCARRRPAAPSSDGSLTRCDHTVPCFGQSGGSISTVMPPILRAGARATRRATRV